MKEKMKHDLPLLGGLIIGMTVVDVISIGYFDWKHELLRIITAILVFVIFRFIESKCTKKK